MDKKYSIIKTELGRPTFLEVKNDLSYKPAMLKATRFDYEKGNYVVEELNQKYGKKFSLYKEQN